MFDIKIVEKAIQSKAFPIEILNKLPSTQMELVLALTVRNNEVDMFVETFKRINFAETSIKSRENFLNWYVSHNLCTTKDFEEIINNKCIYLVLSNGIKFDTKVLAKNFKNVDFYKTFKYCDVLSPEAFNPLFAEPLKTKNYALFNQRLFDVIDYHQKYNQDIPLKFFEKICAYVVPSIFNENVRPADKEQCAASISEFIENFAKSFDVLSHIPQEVFMNLCNSKNVVQDQVQLFDFYAKIRETLLREKMEARKPTQVKKTLKKI